MSEDAKDPNLADNFMRVLKQNAELEKERDRYKRDGELTKMRLEVAERKLADIEQQLVSIAPPKTGTEALAPRVGQLVVRLLEQQQLAETLKNSRRERDAQRTRWERIADAATAHGALRLDDPVASAQAVALYADQLIAQAEARYQVIPTASLDEEDVSS